MNRLDAIEARLKAATPGPLDLGIVDPEVEPGEWFRDHLSYGPDANIWCVWCPKHPLTRGEAPRPEHAVLTAVTGNGPTSEANAEFYAHAPADLAALLELARAASAYIVCLRQLLYAADMVTFDAAMEEVNALAFRYTEALMPLELEAEVPR